MAELRSTLASPTTARLIRPHDDFAPDDYHQWVWLGDTLNCDRIGRQASRRQVFPQRWLRLRCNNGSCTGELRINPDATAEAIELRLKGTVR